MIKNRASLHFVAGTLLIVSAIFLNFYFTHQNDREVLEKNFLTVLEKKEGRLKIFIDLLKNEDALKSDSAKLSENAEFRKLFADEGIALYRFIGDSLVFWSTNAIPLPADLPVTDKNEKDFRRLQNGWYEVIRSRDSTGTYIGLILIQHQYPFQNDFLRNDFQADFNIPVGTVISLTEAGKNSGTMDAGLPVRFTFPDKIPLSGTTVYILFALFFSGFLFWIASMYFIYNNLKTAFTKKWLLVGGFAVDVILLRLLVAYFGIPNVIYSSALFGPGYFFSSSLLPSLGDFFINSILLLVVSYAVFLNAKSIFRFAGKRMQYKLLTILLYVLFIVAGVLLTIWVIRELVLNSSVPMTLQKVSGLSFSSVLSFIIIAAIILSFLLNALRLAGVFSLKNLGAGILMMAVIATLCLNHYNDQIEKEKRKLLAVKLSQERDPVAEMLFSNTESRLLNDPVLRKYNEMNPADSSGVSREEDTISSYLLRKYFRNSWNNYIVQVTICGKNKILRVQPQNYLVSCDSYFNEIIDDFGKPASGKNLYFLDYGYGFRNYLAVIPLGDIHTGGNRYTAYIEINSKLLFKDLGYPELLIDKKQASFPDLAGYSYAFYRNGKLVHRVGNIEFSLELDHSLAHSHGYEHFYTKNGLDSYCYPIDGRNLLLISREKSTLLDRIAPFSFLFFIFVIFSLLFFLVVQFPSVFRPSRIQFSQRLQLFMIGILITSLLVVGFLVVFYITRLNREKNLENLAERAHSISVEIQHSLGSEDDLSLQGHDYLNELMTKYSNVYFCDVNIYSPEGQLMATSRPEIFEKGLISPLMDNVAYANLRYAHSALYTQNEFVGRHRYSSAYLPFFNDRNRLLAYINLPYFARQDDLKRQVSTFMMAFINVYATLIILGFFIALFVSNYITRPLRLLTVGLGKLTLGMSNEKLEWKRNDEVGLLVEEYNRKIDELARSADILARSEREGAWREMAKQIAHEIKNPLTPMKLSVQYLLKSWDEKPPDWESRIRRFTATMIEQIDNLSFIASEFSDFARMPDQANEQIDLNEIIRNAVDLYKSVSNISIEVPVPIPGAIVYADRKQLMRVFTNLFNNSIHAIGENRVGLIRIGLEKRDSDLLILISDNGSGIPPEQAAHIFQPNFTTKSGGMGLGLAIVKNIINSSGGDISFRSEPGNGTIFTIKLPLSRSEKTESQL